jgi:hypothetical protein
MPGAFCLNAGLRGTMTMEFACARALIGDMWSRGGGVAHMAPICARAHDTQLWYQLTGVRLVRYTSVDHR